MADADIAALLVELQRQSDLLALLALPVARQHAASALETDKQRTVYRLTDGKHSVRQIQDEAQVPKSTVQNWWETWRRLGLLSEAGGSPKAIFTLDQVGLVTAGAVKSRKGGEKNV